MCDTIFYPPLPMLSEANFHSKGLTTAFPLYQERIIHMGCKNRAASRRQQCLTSVKPFWQLPPYRATGRVCAKYTTKKQMRL